MLTDDEVAQLANEIERRALIQSEAEECVRQVEERWLEEQGGIPVHRKNGHKPRHGKTARQALAEQATALMEERHGYTGMRIEIRDD